MLLCTAFYIPYWATFNSKAGAHWYARAFLGALVSYGVVVYKSFPVSIWLHKKEETIQRGIVLIEDDGISRE